MRSIAARAGILAALALAVTLAGCASVSNEMMVAQAVVLQRDDVEIIGDVEGRGSITTFLLIFPMGAKNQKGTVAGRTTADAGIFARILGATSLAEANAIYDAIEKSGADALLYPRFESKESGIPLLFTKQTVTVKAKAIKVKTHK